MSDMYQVILDALQKVDPMDIAFASDEYSPEAKWLSNKAGKDVLSVFDIIECFDYHFPGTKMSRNNAEVILEEIIFSVRTSKQEV